MSGAGDKALCFWCWKPIPEDSRRRKFCSEKCTDKATQHSIKGPLTQAEIEADLKNWTGAELRDYLLRLGSSNDISWTAWAMWKRGAWSGEVERAYFEHLFEDVVGGRGRVRPLPVGGKVQPRHKWAKLSAAYEALDAAQREVKEAKRKAQEYKARAERSEDRRRAFMWLLALVVFLGYCAA